MAFSCFGKQTFVARVIDGDTFETESGEKVRLIGINAPEMSDFFGQEAKEYLSGLIEGKLVELRADNLSNDRDRYQRLLRYVIIDGIDINNMMVSEGFAFAYLKYKFSNSEQYKQSQIQAREMSVGIWGDSLDKNGFPKGNFGTSNFWTTISPKVYFITSIFVLFIVYGLYIYFKK